MGAPGLASETWDPPSRFSVADSRFLALTPMPSHNLQHLLRGFNFLDRPGHFRACQEQCLDRMGITWLVFSGVQGWGAQVIRVET
jgi:hypothetical protein